MSKHLERDLEQLSCDIVTIGGLVEEATQQAVTALQERRMELAELVIRNGSKIDGREVEIEDACLKMLALHQPVAEDLRFITSVIKINSDLERMGDLAMNIAQRAVFLTSQDPIPFPSQLSTIGAATVTMVRRSLDALVKRDAQTALQVCRADDEVDRLNREIIAELIALMKKDASMVERALSFFSATRHLERIADHATNIAEDVVYLVEGEIIRHGMNVA